MHGMAWTQALASLVWKAAPKAGEDDFVLRAKIWRLADQSDMTRYGHSPVASTMSRSISTVAPVASRTKKRLANVCR